MLFTFLQALPQPPTEVKVRVAEFERPNPGVCANGSGLREGDIRHNFGRSKSFKAPFGR